MDMKKLSRAMIVILVFTIMAGHVNAYQDVIDEKADSLLRAMSDKLSSVEQMRFSLKKMTDAGLLDDSDVPVTVEGEILVKRPNKLAAEITTKGHRGRIIYDGKYVFVVDVEANCYSRVSAPPTLDAALRMLEMDYDYAPPLADFLLSDPYGNLMRELHSDAMELESGRYVGVENVDGSKVHHITIREKYIDWSLWIDVETMLPKKFVITATGIEGDPKMQMDFLHTELDTAIDDDMFRFSAPKDAVEVPMPKVR